MLTSAMMTPLNITCVNYMVTVIEPEDCAFVSNAAMVFVILSIILIIWGLFNNIVLLLIIFTNGRQMRTLPNIFIANMAFLGVLFLVIVSGGNLLTVGQVAFQVKIDISDSVAKTFFYVQIFVSVASFTTLVVLGLDRYLAIVYPLRSRAHRTKKRAIVCNCLVWIVAGLCMLPIILGDGSRNVFQEYNRPGYRSGLIAFVTIAFVIPVIILFVLYIAILKVIWFNSTIRRVDGEEQARRWKQRIQVFRSIFKVVFTFILHYGYFFAVFLWFVDGGHTRVSARTSNVLLYSAILVFYLNTCINPLIYALQQDSFIPFVYKLLCPKKCHLRKPMEDALHTTQQNSADVTTGTSTLVTSSGTQQDEQDNPFQCRHGPGSTDVNRDLNNGVDVDYKHVHLNEGYHGNEKTSDGHANNSSLDETSGDVTVAVVTSSVVTEQSVLVPAFVQLKMSNEIETTV